MKAILYIAHGTRLQEGIVEAQAFIQSIQRAIPMAIQEIAFLELATPTLEEGMQTCITRGATEILVLPLLLLSAQHIRSDIPQLVDNCRRKTPHIAMHIGEPIGLKRKMILAIAEQLAPMENCEQAQIILIGRGSSHPNIERDFSEIASRFKLHSMYRQVNIAFLYGRGPHVTDLLQKMPYDHVIFVPYLLFSGLLMKNLEAIQMADKQRIRIAQPLGKMKYTKEAFIESVLQNIANWSLKEVI